MRCTALTLAAAVLLASCQPPENRPEAAADAVADTPAPEMPMDAPPQEEVDDLVPPPDGGRPDPASCRAEIGDVAAARLVERCIAVSPATHPPCNAANPCQMIRDEIDRACAMYGADEARPAECAA